MKPSCIHIYRSFALGIAWVSSSCLAQGHDGDIGLRVSTDAVLTTHTISSGGVGPQTRVFRSSFGDTGISGFTSNPGFEALPGTFTVGYRIGFDVGAPLLAWNGSGFGATDAGGPLAGERLKISFITLGITTDATAIPGFSLAVQSDGGWHRHLSFTLQPGTGSPAPDDGIYLLELVLWSTDPTVQPSEHVWLVMNNGRPLIEHEAAEAWVIANLLPTPCPADLQPSGQVDGQDLAILLGGWGSSGSADIDASGVVDGSDLTILLSAWGACP